MYLCDLKWVRGKYCIAMSQQHRAGWSTMCNSSFLVSKSHEGDPCPQAVTLYCLGVIQLCGLPKPPARTISS